MRFFLKRGIKRGRGGGEVTERVRRVERDLSAEEVKGRVD